jgi:beta-glucanase (GH16 family)
VNFNCPSRLIGVTCLLALLQVVVGHVAQASVVTDSPHAWKLTFSDEFSGASLDTDKWAHRLPGPRHDAINASNAVSVSGGLLTIKTYTDAGIHYTGMIGTQEIFEQTFGYFEARMKFHSSAGQWSAFWLTSPTYGNPIGDPGQAGTEIDIAEHRATNPNGADLRSRYVSAVHWDGYGAEHQQVAKTHGPLAGLANDTWHTYGLRWSPSGYEFYFDDALMWTVTQAVSRRDEYLILSSEVRDGNWAGDVPAGGYGTFASSVTNMQVDYVRVYSSVAGDFNSNDSVDAADYVVWRKTDGGTDSYGQWRANYGGTPLTGGALARSSTTSPMEVVPEPATVVLLMMGGAVVNRRSRGRSSYPTAKKAITIQCNLRMRTAQ